MKSDFRRGRCANTQDGFTVLHDAARVGSKEVVEFLLQNGADVGRTDKVTGMNMMRVANCSCYIDLTNSGIDGIGMAAVTSAFYFSCRLGVAVT